MRQGSKEERMVCATQCTRTGPPRVCLVCGRHTHGIQENAQLARIPQPNIVTAGAPHATADSRLPRPIVNNNIDTDSHRQFINPDKFQRNNAEAVSKTKASATKKATPRQVPLSRAALQGPNVKLTRYIHVTRYPL